MICAACGEETLQTPCGRCGADALLDGRYSLERVLGQGTTGTTFEAVRLDDITVFPGTGTRVAIKEMPLRRADADKTRQLLSREIRVLRQLQHPQIPHYFDDFVAGAGKHAALYLVMELVEGIDLAREMDRRRYDETEVLDIVEGLLRVLGYLHTRSPPVIHRDVKPRNVMRRPDGSLVLLDYGAVRDVLVDSQLGGSTVAGTFGYMAPEQFRGDAAPASDIYGLGALAIALLTRRDPHTLADSGGVLRWESHASVSPPVARLIGRMIERDLVRRPSDAVALRAEVQRILSDLRNPKPAPPPVDPSSVSYDGSLMGFGAPFAEPPERIPPAPPFEPPTVHSPAGLVHRAASPLKARGPLLMLVIVLVFFAFAAAGIVIAGVAVRVPGAHSRATGLPAMPAPVLSAPACAIAPRETQIDGKSTTSRFQFAGATADGKRVAMFVARPSDARAEIIVYEAGARSETLEKVIPPDTYMDALRRVDGEWEPLVLVLLAPYTGKLQQAGLDLNLRPEPVSWCQDGEAVRVGDATWSWRTFTEACTITSGVNTSFELCPSGATDAAACIVPPLLEGGCWDDAPRLVDLFRLGDALWAVAERPHGSTIPRFAGGVMLESPDSPESSPETQSPTPPRAPRQPRATPGSGAP